MFGLWWLWYLVGTIGIGGVVAAWFLAPVVAQPIISGLFRFLFGTRIGVGLMAGILCFAAADIHRSRMDEAEWKERVAAFEAAQKARDVRIEQQARTIAENEIKRQALETAATNRQMTEFEDALPKPPPAVPGGPDCDKFLRVGADADKLRALGGAAEGRPQRAQAVPASRRWRLRSRHQGGH